MSGAEHLRGRHLIAPLLRQEEVDRWPETSELAPLVRRLLLFDRVTLETPAFREVPAMVSAFGYDGLMQLLDSGALRFKRHGEHLSEWAGGGVLGHPDRPVRLPAEFFAFGYVSLPDFERKRHNSEAFAEFTPRLGLPDKQVKKLKKAIAERIVDLPMTRSEILPGIRKGDLSILRESIALVSAEEFSAPMDPGQLKLDVEYVPRADLKHGDAIFRATSNVQDLTKVDEETARTILQRGFFGVQGVDQRLDMMNSLGGIGGFRPRERQLFDVRFAAVLSQVETGQQETDLTRVIKLAGLPDLSDGDLKVDAEKLLEIRESDAACALREWLPTTSTLPDEEVAALFDDLSERVASLYQSKAGKGARFLVSAGLDVLPWGGTAASLGFGALDTFVLENLAKPGPVSFLSDAYAGIYRPQGA